MPTPLWKRSKESLETGVLVIYKLQKEAILEPQLSERLLDQYRRLSDRQKFIEQSRTTLKGRLFSKVRSSDIEEHWTACVSFQFEVNTASQIAEKDEKMKAQAMDILERNSPVVGRAYSGPAINNSMPPQELLAVPPGMVEVARFPVAIMQGNGGDTSSAIGSGNQNIISVAASGTCGRLTLASGEGASGTSVVHYQVHSLRYQRSCTTLNEVHHGERRRFTRRYSREEVETSSASIPKEEEETIRVANEVIEMVFSEDPMEASRPILNALTFWPEQCKEQLDGLTVEPQQSTDRDTKQPKARLVEAELLKHMRKFPTLLQDFTLDFLQETMDWFDALSEPEDDELRMQCAMLIRRFAHKASRFPPSLFIKGVVSQGTLPRHKGGYGLVYRGTLSGHAVAMKVLSYVDRDSEEALERQRQRFYREAIIWRHLRHRNILPLIGVHTFPEGDPAMVSRWCDRGNLLLYLRSHHGECNRLYLLARIADALRYLHCHYDPPLVHKDIKPENILVDDQGEPCLTDFGISTYYQSFTITEERGSSGTFPYMAPELLRFMLGGNLNDRNDQIRKAISPAYDIYAFACVSVVVYTDLTKTEPWCRSIAWPDPRVIDGLRPPRPDGDLQDELWSIIQRCWSGNPEERMKSEALAEALAAMVDGQSCQ